MTIGKYLDESVRLYTDKVALICGSSMHTYRSLGMYPDRYANFLKRLGPRTGDRVAIYLENSVEAVISILASSRPMARLDVVIESVKQCSLLPTFIFTGTNGPLESGFRLEEIINNDQPPANILNIILTI